MKTETITDHELLIIANDWAKEIPYENIGIRTAFAAGYRLAEKQANGQDTGERQLTIPDVRLALSGFWAWYAELSIEELEWYNGKEVETYLATF